jgi:hypothetical protein
MQRSPFPFYSNIKERKLSKKERWRSCMHTCIAGGMQGWMVMVVPQKVTPLPMGHFHCMQMQGQEEKMQKLFLPAVRQCAM